MGSVKVMFQFLQGAWPTCRADVLLVPVYQEREKSSTKNKKTKKGSLTLAKTAAIKALDKALQGYMLKAAEEEKFTAEKSALMMFRKSPADKVTSRRVILVGLGEKTKLKVANVEATYLKALGQAMKLKDVKTVAMALPEETDDLSLGDALQAMVDAVYQVTYQSLEATKKPRGFKQALLLTDKAPNNALKQRLKQVEVLAQARALTKDLVNKPSNLKTTKTLADEARRIAKLPGMSVQIQSDSRWIEKHMPCFYEVARGSVKTDPPRWITLAYRPARLNSKSKSGSIKPKKKIALVGKSVIFDTGGYQVKTGDYMNTMKGDMAGGASVLATMEAIATLKPNVEVTAYLAATPNKIDSQAMIPDAIVNTTCGKKVEIRHTDAEGRLTLIDAVTMASRGKPDELVTIATLTGSASMAVGQSIALMANNKALRDRIEQAARSLGEPVQSLDVVEEDYDKISSSLDGADIRNTHKGKGRGAQTAAAFVMSGAPEGLPVAHLDIAGADMTTDEKATGIGAKTLIQYVLNAG